MNAYEASNYGEWFAANFLAVPMLMGASMLLVFTGAFVAMLATGRLKVDNPTKQSRLILLGIVDVAAAWGCWRTVEMAWLPSILTAENIAWIATPTLLVGLVMFAAWRQTSKCSICRTPTPTESSRQRNERP